MRNLILLFMLVIVNSFSAQDSNDIKAIQSQMNTKELDKLSNIFKEKNISRAELKRRAKKMKIPFCGKSNGVYFELVGFDIKGKPIYNSEMK